MDSTNSRDLKEALSEKDGSQVWWRLLRRHTLTAPLILVFVGPTVAYLHGPIHIPASLALLFSSIVIEAATNMFNEYYDYVRGLDTEESVGIGGTIVRDGIAPKTIYRLAVTFFGIATILGLYISIASSWWVAVIGLIGM